MVGRIMMKTLILPFLVVFNIIIVNAQEWYSDFNQAQKVAMEQNRNIILVFQGSDWCAPCMKLEKEIWSSEEFKNYAKLHYVLLKADFPRKKANRLSKEQQEKNNKLAEKYNQQGYFPLVVVLSKSGKVLGKTGYKNISPEEYIKLLDSISESHG